MIFSSRLANKFRSQWGFCFPRLGEKVMNTVIAALPKQFDCDLLPGISVPINTDDLTQRTTYWQGERFEMPTAPILAKFGESASAFFDIGANYGFFSYWMLHMCPRIEVYSFEPNPRSFELITRIQARNSLSRLHPQNVGLADLKNTLTLHSGREDSGHSTFTDHPGLLATPTVDVDVAAFDEWATAINPLTHTQGDWVAKIDVEGFELKVLRGMEKHLQRKAFRLVAVEMNDYTLNLAGTTPEALRQFLRKVGYASLLNQPEGGRWQLTKTANEFFVPA